MFCRKNKLEKLLESHLVDEIVAVVIIINAISLFASTSNFIVEHYGKFIETIDLITVVFFICELFLRLFVYRLNFFKNSWNYFDAFIVIIALIPNTGYLTVLRALRILRLVRLIRIFPRMTFLIASLKDSVSGIVSVFLFISLFFSLFSFIAFNLFKTANVEYFGTMGLTIQTMFQIMSSEGWEQVIRPIEAKIPYSNLFFITYILLMKFTLLNLFLGLILNSMQAASRRENRMAIEKLSTNLEVATELETKIEVTLEKKVDVLMSEIQTLRKLLAEKSK